MRYDFHALSSRKNDESARRGIDRQQVPAYCSHVLARKRINGGINGGIINDASIRSLDFKRDYAFPMCLLLRNMRPIGHQVVYLCFSFFF